MAANSLDTRVAVAESRLDADSKTVDGIHDTLREWRRDFRLLFGAIIGLYAFSFAGFGAVLALIAKAHGWF